MEQIQSPKSTEQRRKLLKSALAASSVAGLGYSGSALASVTQCIQSQTTAVVGDQFKRGENPPAPGANNWAWKKVTVNQYRINGIGSRIEGFALTSGNVYRAAAPWDQLNKSPTTAVLANQTNFVPWSAWVVVYFDSVTGQEVGSFPEFQAPQQLTGQVNVAQASVNCLSSLNAGTAGNYSFGG